MTTDQVRALFCFLRHIRRVSPAARHEWLMPNDPQKLYIRSFRWASAGRNDYLTLAVHGDILLVLIGGVTDAHAWVRAAKAFHSDARRLDLRVGWF